MAQKKITELQLASSLTDSFSVPGDNGIQTYRFTPQQIYDNLRPKFTPLNEELNNIQIDFSVASSAATIALKTQAGTNPSSTDVIRVAFRSATLASGAYLLRTVSSALSTVISSGSTLGFISARRARIHVYLIDNAGTLELAYSQKLHNETNLISTTAEGGAGAADSATVMYSTAARSNVAFRHIGYIDSTQTTAGTWAQTATKILACDWKTAATEHCHVQLEGSSTTAAGGATNVAWNTVVQDTHSIYSSGEITIPFAACWQIKLHVRHSTSGTATVNQVSLCYIQVDSVTTKQGYDFVQNTGVQVWKSEAWDSPYLTGGQKVRFQHETTISSPNIGTGSSDTYATLTRVVGS